MAFYKKVTEGWRLTDGILPESLLAEPCGVYEALLEAGHVSDAKQGLNAMLCEWISARKWIYSVNIDTPEEDDERLLIEFPKVCGSGRAYLNGEEMGAFTSGAVRMELTGYMKSEGANELKLCFDPMLYARPDEKHPVAQVGVMCAPILRAVNYAAVEKVRLTSRMEGDEGIICVQLAVNSHVSGKYTFRYAVSLDGDAAGMYAFTERLPAAARIIRHELKVKDAVKLNLKKLEETVYGIKFSLERGGIGCDVRHMETAFRAGGRAMRALAVQEYPVSGDMIDRLLELGADGIVLSGMPQNAFEKNDFLGGLTVVQERVYAAHCGMVREDALHAYAAGEEVSTLDSAVWKLRGGVIPQENELYKKDADRFARQMRFLQAADLLRRAAECRRDKICMTAQADEAFAYFASDAIYECGGSVRPAEGALMHAWNAAHAFCELPAGGRVNCGELLSMNVWALVEDMYGQVLSLDVRVMTADGRTLNEETFPVMGGDVRLAGVVNVRVPGEEGVLIARTTLNAADASCIDRTDGVLFAGETSEMALIAKMENTTVSRRGITTRNDGGRLALSAGICLLPGEGTDRADIEWVNA